MTDASTEQISVYTARDGAGLPYRFFEASSDRVLVFLHGISEPSLYLRAFGEAVAGSGLASVYLPDLRGYGSNPIRRGHIDYMGQLDDDLEDLIVHIKERHPSARLILGGHSAGGATAIRQAIRPVSADVDAYLLLSPALSPSSPIDRKEKGVNDAKVDVPKVVLLSILNAVGITRWNDAIVYRRTPQKERLHGTETLDLSYNLVLSRMVGNRYENYLSRLTQPTLVLVSGEDEVFLPEAYAPLYAKYCKAEVKVLPGHDHDRIVSSEEALEAIRTWWGWLPF